MASLTSPRVCSAKAGSRYFEDKLLQSLVFEAEDVRRVAEHSIGAGRQAEKRVYGAAPEGTEVAVSEPAVILVHDRGVYLMSNGEPRDLVEGERSFVAYARGCHPLRDANYRAASRALVGGHDFSRVLPWARDLKALIDAGARTVVLNLHDGKIEIAAA